MLVAALVSLSFAHAAETCTPRNAYLEKALPKASTQVAGDLPRRCVEAAQAGFPASGVYGFCAGDVGRISRSKARPCLSENYVGAVTQAIADAAECLGFDARAAFATFNLESGAHLNAVGAAGDAGVGQLTKSAIEEVNRRDFAAARERIAKSNSAACRAILPRFTKASSDAGHRCAFISAPANPVRNVVYSILLIQRNQKYVDLFWNRLNVKAPSGIDVDRLKEQLTTLAYNAGAAGSVAVAAAFVRQMGPKLTEAQLDFENKGPHGLYAYVAGHFPIKGARRKRIAGYVPGLIAAARRTEARAGRTCFDPDLFSRGPVPFAPDEGWDDDAADAIVAEELVTLAESFKPARAGFNCEDARAEFRAIFLPPDASEDEMPFSVKQAYDKLCGK